MGRLDFLIHSLAFAPKADLQRRLVDSSVEGFLTVMDISCHSLVRMAGSAQSIRSFTSANTAAHHLGMYGGLPHPPQLITTIIGQ
jgi:enoyl-[acyl-carrier protein] reductase I